MGEKITKTFQHYRTTEEWMKAQQIKIVTGKTMEEQVREALENYYKTKPKSR